MQELPDSLPSRGAAWWLSSARDVGRARETTMLYTRFGNTGLIVSRLAFGAMTFGTGNIPAVYKVDESGAANLIDRVLDAGINFFDTADAYADGASELMLGKLLGARRKDVVIST